VEPVVDISEFIVQGKVKNVKINRDEQYTQEAGKDNKNYQVSQKYLVWHTHNISFIIPYQR
jgi:hypothetical protein